MKKKFAFSLLLLFTLFVQSAYAAVGVKNSQGKRDSSGISTTVPGGVQATDLNFIGVPQLYFDGSTVTVDETYIAATGGTITGTTLTSNTQTSGTIDGTTLGQTTRNTFYKSVTLLAATQDTVGTVTAAKSGSDFILTSTTGPVTASNGLGWTLTLPQATANTTGLNYTFMVATSQSLAVVAVTGDTIAFGGGCSRMTSPASSPCTLALVSNSNGTWYVENILPANTGSTLWVSGSR